MKTKKVVKKVVKSSKPAAKVVKKAVKPVKPVKKVAKPAVKAKPVKKVVRKAKPEAPALRPIKTTMNKSQLIAHFVEKMDTDRKTVNGFFNELENVISASLNSKGAGVFALPGLFKIVTVKVAAKKMPAIKKGTPVRNPSTGEMMPSKGRAAFTKPATVRVKVRALAKLKGFALA